jgi:predicted DNA-binding protein YlxM (UPF0122 family)
MTQTRNPKYDDAPALYESGMSIGECADFYQITRQAMWKILKRRGVQFRPKLKFQEENHFHRGGSRKSVQAEQLARRAIKKGILIRKSCEVCGDTQTQAHHDNYNNPLDVRWLCQKHHFEWHQNNKPISLTSPIPMMSSREIRVLGGKASWKNRR